MALRKNQSPLRNTSSVAPAVLPLAWGVKSLLTCREPQGPSAMEEVPWMDPPLLAPKTEAPTKKWSWIYHDISEYDFPALGQRLDTCNSRGSRAAFSMKHEKVLPKEIFFDQHGDPARGCHPLVTSANRVASLPDLYL